MPTKQPRTMVTLERGMHERALALARKEGIPLATWIARLVLLALAERPAMERRRAGKKKEEEAAAGEGTEGAEERYL